jgi:hypothetical protein
MHGLAWAACPDGAFSLASLESDPAEARWYQIMTRPDDHYKAVPVGRCVCKSLCCYCFCKLLSVMLGLNQGRESRHLLTAIFGLATARWDCRPADPRPMAMDLLCLARIVRIPRAGDVA